jgi:hypothetical protein
VSVSCAVTIDHYLTRHHVTTDIEIRRDDVSRLQEASVTNVTSFQCELCKVTSLDVPPCVMFEESSNKGKLEVCRDFNQRPNTAGDYENFYYLGYNSGLQGVISQNIELFLLLPLFSTLAIVRYCEVVHNVSTAQCTPILR